MGEGRLAPPQGGCRGRHGGPLAPWRSLNHGTAPLASFAILASKFPQPLGFGRSVLVWHFALVFWNVRYGVRRLQEFGPPPWSAGGEWRTRGRPPPGEAVPEFQRSQQRGCSPFPLPPHTAPALFLPQDEGASGRTARLLACGAPRLRRACGDWAGRGGARPGGASGGSGLCARAPWGGRGRCACA